MLCDLHTHSVFSDGTWTPEELVEEAERIGLAAIALTDHNTVAGLPRFLRAAQGKAVEAVPGVEFSTDYRGIDLHIVALDVCPAQFERVTALMEEGVRAKQASNLDLAQGLCRAGYPVDYAAICSAVPGGQPNRAHFAAALVEQGCFPDRQAAFRTVLDPSFGLYHPPKRPDVFEIIRFIRSIGAVSVMAHPFLKLDETGVREFLRQALPAGLDAMETRYVSFDEKTTALAIRIAGESGLRQSGGSDFHGANKPGISIGTGLGGLRVPAEFLPLLRRPR